MSFSQGTPAQPLALVARNVFVTGVSTTGNALTVQQLSAGQVASFQTSTGATAFIVGNGSGVSSRFVAVASTGTAGSYSNDGVNWVAMTLPSSQVWRAVAVNYTTGRFVAVAQGPSTAAAYSDDGINWIASTLPSSSSWTGLTVNPTTGRFVAVGGAPATTAAYSDNGSTWVAATLPSSASWNSVTVNPNTGRFVAIGYSGTSAAYSDNGSTWTAATLPSSSGWTTVTVNPNTGRFVVVATGPSNISAYSDNGSTWTAATLPSSANWQGVVCNPTTGRFVAVAGPSGTAAAYSDNGSTWIAATLPSAGNWNSVTVNPSTGRFVVVVYGSAVAAYSDNGATWTAATLSASTNWNSVTSSYTIASVGVNKPNPSYTLDVSGDVNFSGTLRQNGNVFTGGGGAQWTTAGSTIYYTLGNVGVGTNNPSAYTLQVQGTLGVSGDITALYSDERLKTKTGTLVSALDKVTSLETFTYRTNELALSLGFEDDYQRVGVSAQQVQKVLPEAVRPAPFDANNQSGQNYLTVQYEKLVPLLIEALKEERRAREKLDEQIKIIIEKLV